MIKEIVAYQFNGKMYSSREEARKEERKQEMINTVQKSNKYTSMEKTRGQYGPFYSWLDLINDEELFDELLKVNQKYGEFK